MEPYVEGAARAGGRGAPPVYAGRTVALLTQHRKELVITPVLEAGLGCVVELVTGFDTDRFGTFTREIPRPGTLVETARKKARQGMVLSGLPLGVASEGAFGPDPVIGFMPWNVELVIWVDDALGLEVMGTVANSRTNFDHLVTADWDELSAFARKVGFPDHHLVVRPDGADDPRVRKGLSDWEALEGAFAWALAQSAGGRVFVETDMRAHANPTRMTNIRAAAEDLVSKLRCPCPACRAPGFAVAGRVPGRPCELCGTPTPEPVAEVHRCPRCGHEQRAEPDGAPARAPAAVCPFCNP